MKDQIEQVLTPLLGLCLLDMYRFLGYQAFRFIPPHAEVNAAGEVTTEIVYAFHIACEWHVYDHQKAVLGSDSYGPTRGERREELAGPFFEKMNMDSLLVESISANDQADFTVHFPDGYRLEVLARNSIEDDEYWTLLCPESRHFIFEPNGLKFWQDDGSE